MISPLPSPLPLLLGPDGQPLPEPTFTAEQVQELIDHAYDSLPADFRRKIERQLASIARLNGVLARHFYLESWHRGFWPAGRR